MTFIICLYVDGEIKEWLTKSFETLSDANKWCEQNSTLYAVYKVMQDEEAD